MILGLLSLLSFRSYSKEFWNKILKSEISYRSSYGFDRILNYIFLKRIDYIIWLTSDKGNQYGCLLKTKIHSKDKIKSYPFFIKITLRDILILEIGLRFVQIFFLSKFNFMILLVNLFLLFMLQLHFVTNSAYSSI